MNGRRLIHPGLVAALAVFLGPSVSWAESAKLDFIELGKILERGVEARAFPGCTVTVGTSEKILWSGAFGRFDYTAGARVKRTTIYDLASVTKVAGTTAVYMRLVALGKVRISDPVGKYLPEFIAAAASDDEKTQRTKITVEHLLTHTAGITAWKPFYKSVNSYADLLQAIYRTPLETEPGAKFRYSDPGMILAGELAARIGGKPLAQLERDLVFRPLGMNGTVRNPPAKLRARIPPTERLAGTGEFVRGVVHDENARAGEGITGHAGLFSTAADLGKLAAELLRALDNRSKLFPQEIVADFFTGRQLVKSAHRGLGWGLVRNRDGSYGPAVSHNGFTGTYVWIDPQRNLYVVLLTNRVHPTRDNDKVGRVRAEFVDAVVKAFDESQAKRP